MEGKGLLLGLAALVVALLVLFGVALASGGPDDGSGEDCIEEFC